MPIIILMPNTAHRFGVSPNEFNLNTIADNANKSITKAIVIKAQFIMSVVLLLLFSMIENMDIASTTTNTILNMSRKSRSINGFCPVIMIETINRINVINTNGPNNLAMSGAIFLTIFNFKSIK